MPDLSLSSLPAPLRLLLLGFLTALTFGYLTGIYFLKNTGQVNPSGIEANYLGNEEQEVMEEEIKFRMSEGELLTIIHTHVLSLSLIFLALAGLIYLCKIPSRLKLFFVLEPFVAILSTFGGLWLLWKGWNFMDIVIMISGILMHG